MPSSCSRWFRARIPSPLALCGRTSFQVICLVAVVSPHMTSIWVESLSRSFEEALDLLAAAVRDCTDELWESSMWEVPADLFGSEPPGPDGKPVTDPAARSALAQRRSTPWSVAWHTLECLDHDLTGEFGPWAPPPPFTGKPHWLMT